ncbi:regulator of MON1-CCZ1 complex-like isoform X1 [Lytechinus variegatus]|uniref:regulator of MON1-CCZ1 complex-like isoform X1 n=1 Tax=Lytechinus variegatus TaxID=7654 RepID=UPI001BB14BE3|nr:regulator of MON1-CCZ1 complex-like isoform X1 [Lytechinus variegatus]
MAEDQSHYVELSGNPIRFEPISRQTNVFYDEVKRQVFAVRSGGAFGVVVKGPDEKTSTTFRMEDKGPVISIKFSSDLRILAVQRSQRTVEFINFHTGSADTSEYSQMCKGKNTKIIGFNWVSGNEIVFITDHGLELYQVTAEKKTLRSMKNVSISINWFTFMNESALLLVSSSTLGNVLTPIHCKTGNISKLPKFEVDLPVVPKPPKLCLLERDVTIAILYSVIYVVVLRHQPRGPSNQGAEIVLYQLQRESPAKKTDVLRLNMSGRFAVNVVDNLVVVHHQASKTSMVFDIGLTPNETDNYCNYHHPVLAPLPIKPVKLKVAGIPTQTGLEMREVGVELYSPNWVVFQPNIVIDAKLGCLWHISLRLDALVPMIPDKCRLIDFLLLRRESKKVILYVLQTALVPGQHCNLATIAKIFNKLNEVYRSYLAERHALHVEETSSPKNSQSAARVSLGTRVVIEQSDMYTHVLTPVAERKARMKDSNHKFLVAVLVEYIRSLNQYQIPVQHFLYELVINTLVHHNCFYQLHQFLQYHVLSDSKPIACLLLSLESCYPPAYQLALDMLKRLTTANEEIIEVLLSKNQILAALRFLRSVGGAENASSRKFLEAALNADDDMLFYTVFKFFEQRNLRMRGNPLFAPGEHCEKFVHVFEQKFGYESFVPIQ